MQQHTDHTRIFYTLFLAAAILLGWQAMVEHPRRQQLAAMHAKQAEEQAKIKAREEKAQTLRDTSGSSSSALLTRKERLALSPRVTFATEKLQGSIALKGARFDDLVMPKYRVELAETSPAVTLFSPNGDIQAYFAQAGWISADNKTQVPDQNSLWQADKQSISANKTVTLRWTNNANVTFIIIVSLDENYMFQINQRVENGSGALISVTPYAYINRQHEEDSNIQHYAILHEGPLGVMQDALEEIGYEDLRKEKKTFSDASGWMGITDKYWLSALIPNEKGYNVTYSHYTKDKHNRYQVDYVSKAQQIQSGGHAESSLRLFAGAKEIRVIDAYANGDVKHPPIPLFDRAVDFGVLYFLTKPMFLMLNFFFTHTGNFGIAILLLTIIVKLMMFPLANKSYKASAQMRKLQPEMQKLRDRYGDDQIRMQQEIMAMYKREKVNPAAGCLPLLVQMPVFFALYKVLFVTIEMRHAPFFGWLKDLSVIDPSNIFTLFGILDWNHPSWMHLGILPILMCATMVIQMKQQPKPTDPIQAKMIAFMPYFFLFIFASFPAGLVLYWVWSNMLSILQQHVISKKYGGKQNKEKA